METRISQTATPTPASRQPAFREIQRPHQWWVWIAIGAGTAALSWCAFLHQIAIGLPFGPEPAPDWVVLLFWALFGVLLPVLFVTSHLTAEVHDDGLHVNYFPFFRRRIAFADIASCKAVIYQPLAHYGGWGIRVNMDGSWVWSVSGDEGVQLVFRSGKRVLIGSRSAAAFAAAIETRRRTFS